MTEERPLRLITLSERPTLRTYLPLLAANRELAFSIARNDLRSRHGGLVLGWLWNLLDPLMMLGVYWLVFGVLLAGRRPEHFLAFLAVGIFLFRFTQSSVVGGAEAVQKNLDMIRQVRFARAILPLAEVLRNLLTLYWQIPIIVTIVLLTSGRFRPGWMVLMVVLIPMLAVFAFGWALLFARLAHGLADVTNFLPYAFRILFYASGILFPIDTILADSQFRDWLPLNPVYSFILLARHLTLAPVAETAVLWMSVTTWTAVSITLGLRLFIAAEHRYGRG